MIFYVSDLALSDHVYADLLNHYLSAFDDRFIMKNQDPVNLFSPVLAKISELVSNKKKRKPSQMSNKENMSLNLQGSQAETG